MIEDDKEKFTCSANMIQSSFRSNKKKDKKSKL